MKNFVSVQGLKTFYRDEGTGSPILILHGWGSSTESWREVQENLVELGFRVITIDMPGFGKTEEPAEPWNLENYSNFIHALSQKINLAKFIILGHSFGGRVAIDYSIRWPNQLIALVLVATAGVVRHVSLKTKVALGVSQAGNLFFSVPVIKKARPLAEKIWYKFLHEHDYQRATPVMKETMKLVLEQELRAYLPNITPPTLILWGDRDTSTPLRDAFILNKNITNSHLHIFPDMPHALNLKAPREIAKQVAKFLGNINQKP